MSTPVQPSAARSVDESGADLIPSGTRAAVEGLLVVNTGTATGWLQLFFGPLADVTVGTTAPDVSLPIPSGATVPVPLGNRVVGLSAAFTGGAADATAPDGVAAVVAYLDDGR